MYFCYGFFLSNSGLSCPMVVKFHSPLSFFFLKLVEVMVNVAVLPLVGFFFLAKRVLDEWRIFSYFSGTRSPNATVVPSFLFFFCRLGGSVFLSSIRCLPSAPMTPIAFPLFFFVLSCEEFF